MKRLIGDKVVAVTIPVSQLAMLPVRPDASRAIEGRQVRISYATDETRDPARLVADLAASHVDLIDLDVSSPSLDDVFAHLNTTGAMK
jgi:ABC-2 type transport system ATP-binding protein